MKDLFTLLEEKNISLPDNISALLQDCKKLSVFNTTDDLAIAATDGEENMEFEVKYDVPGKGLYTEAIVHRVRNGISANYSEAYMRRRDPDTMVIRSSEMTAKCPSLRPSTPSGQAALPGIGPRAHLPK